MRQEGRATLADWDEVPPIRRLSAAWLATHRDGTYLAQDDARYQSWLNRLDHPSCHRAVVCILNPWLFAPCALHAAPGQRYCPKHGGQHATMRWTPLRAEEAHRYGRSLEHLSPRTRSTLWRNGLVAADAVRAMPDGALLGLRNFGDRMLEEVRTVLGRSEACPQLPASGARHPWWLTA